jgi:hypothetical protein
MMVGIRRGEPDAFSAGHGVCGPPSPFRRPTKAHEELATYIRWVGVEAAVDGAFLGSDAIRDAALSRIAALLTRMTTSCARPSSSRAPKDRREWRIPVVGLWTATAYHSYWCSPLTQTFCEYSV